MTEEDVIDELQVATVHAGRVDGVEAAVRVPVGGGVRWRDRSGGHR